MVARGGRRLGCRSSGGSNSSIDISYNIVVIAVILIPMVGLLVLMVVVEAGRKGSELKVN